MSFRSPGRRGRRSSRQAAENGPSAALVPLLGHSLRRTQEYASPTCVAAHRAPPGIWTVLSGLAEQAQSAWRSRRGAQGKTDNRQPTMDTQWVGFRLEEGAVEHIQEERLDIRERGAGQQVSDPTALRPAPGLQWLRGRPAANLRPGAERNRGGALPRCQRPARRRCLGPERGPQPVRDRPAGLLQPAPVRGTRAPAGVHHARSDVRLRP